MALKRPTSINAVPQVTDKALELAGDLAHINLTKFRFKFGCAFIVMGILLFLAGHFKPLLQFFASDFTDRSWTLTLLLLALGAAFSGKEVVEAFVSAFKSIPK